jgi:hypothetical protein
MIDINKEAEEYAKEGCWEGVRKLSFIAGHNSKATQSKIIQAQIDMLNSLDSKLQSKIESLIYMASEKNSDTEYFTIKISGIKLIKEEIRRDLKELQQQLKQLENEI